MTGVVRLACGLLFRCPGRPWRNTASLQVDHAHDHRAARIERQVLESPPGIEFAHPIVDRMGNDPEAADLARGCERRAKREQKERARMPLSLIASWPIRNTGTGSGLLRWRDFGRKARSI